MREANLHLGIRWFAGYHMDDQIPDHSTLSKLRQRWGLELFKKIFKRTVQQCMDAGLVDVETVHVDATLIRANASWDSIVEVYADEVVRENDDEDNDNAGKPDGKRGGGKKKKKKVSKTDPDCSLACSRKFDKPQPRYKQHTAVDNKSGVVVDVDVTTGRAQESHELVGQIRRVEENTGMKPGKVTCDKSYSTGVNYAAMEKEKIEAVIPTRKESRKGKSIPIRRFKYNERYDYVKCPGGKKMRRGSKSVNGGWHYVARVADCKKCHLRERCVSEKRKSRSVVIVDGYTALLRARRRSARKKITATEEYKRHRWMVEGRQGEAKEFHGLRRAVRRGLDQVAIHVYMTAAVMNLKRLAAAVNPKRLSDASFAVLHALIQYIPLFQTPSTPRQSQFLFRSIFLAKKPVTIPFA